MGYTQTANAQATGDYQSHNSGTWATAANWERWNGSSWVNPAPSAPTSADGVVTILNGHTMTNAANGLTIDQLVIASGGQLTINSTVTWTLANGTGTDLDIQGTLLNQGGTWTVTGAAWTVSSGGNYIHNTTSGVATPLGQATFNANGTMTFRGSSTLTPAISVSGRTFGNLVCESTSGALGLAFTGGSALTVNGDFTVGSNVTITNSMSGTNVFAGSYTINGTMTNSTNTQIYSFTGSGKTIGGSGTNAFETMTIGSSASYTMNGHFNVANTFTATINGSLDCATYVFSGFGTVVVSGTGTIKTGHSLGLTSSLTSSGRTFNSGFKIEFNGTIPQTTGLIGLTLNAGNSTVTVSNTSGTVTLNTNLTFGNSSSFVTNTNTTFDASTFTLAFGTSPTATIAGIFQTSNTNGFSGGAGTTFTNANTPTFTLTNSTISYTSGSSQAVTSRSDYANLLLSGGSTKTAGGAITLSGTLTVGSSETFTLAANTLAGGTYSGTGTISLDALSQVSGFSNSFSGTYYLTGTNPNVPTGTYAGLTVNGGGATMTGDVTVSGTLNLNGTLNVGANTLTISNPIGNTITNLVTSSSSSIVVGGTAANIHIPSTVTALTNLTVNSNQVVTADASITVSNSFTLGGSSFVLDMGANTLTIGTSTSNLGSITRTTGGSVRGIVKRWFGTSTTSGTVFPLNNGASDYVGVGISFTGAPATGGTLTASYTTSGAGSIPGGSINFGAAFPGVNLVNISTQFWTVTDGDGLAGFTYSIDLEANSMGVSTTGSNYLYTAILKRNTGGGNTWAWNSANHSNTSGSGTNPISHGVGFTSFSDFAIGGNIDNALPVELSSFTSTVSGTNVTLNWSTSTETNNSGYDIERKTVTGGWSKIGNVEGHGTVNTPNSYTFSDRNLASGRYSYRLKQIDYNGGYKYYNLANEITIGTPSKYALSQNFPNPFNPSTTISYEIPSNNFVSLKIYDMMGREVANLVNATQEAGFYTVKFDGSKLASGMYFYKLQANDFTATKKLMLVK